MKEKLFNVISASALMALAGCTSISTLNSGAEHIKIVTGGIPKNCNLRGKVSINETEIYGPSHKTVQIGQLNKLKSQAIKLGANLIKITNHQTKYYEHPEYIIEEGKIQWELDAHGISGLAYHCPSIELNQIGKSGERRISDVRSIDE